MCGCTEVLISATGAASPADPLAPSATPGPTSEDEPTSTAPAPGPAPGQPSAAATAAPTQAATSSTALYSDAGVGCVAVGFGPRMAEFGEGRKASAALKPMRGPHPCLGTGPFGQQPFVSPVERFEFFCDCLTDNRTVRWHFFLLLWTVKMVEVR